MLFVQRNAEPAPSTITLLSPLDAFSPIRVNLPMLITSPPLLMIKEFTEGLLAPICRKLDVFGISHSEPDPVTTTVLLLSPSPVPSPRRPVPLMRTPPAEIVTVLFGPASP